MLIEFFKNDELTQLLKSKGYTVSDCFFPNTTIKMGYSVQMAHTHINYHVKTNSGDTGLYHIIENSILASKKKGEPVDQRVLNIMQNKEGYQLFMFSFAPIVADHSSTGIGNTLSDIHYLLTLTKKTSSITRAKTLLNLYPRTQQEKKNQRYFIEYAHKIGCVFIFNSPDSYIVSNFSDSN